MKQLDLLIFFYFVIDIPISIFIDAQGLVALRPFYPSFLRNLVIWYCESFGDFLFLNPPAWFQSFIVMRIIFQIPLLLLNVLGFLSCNNFYIILDCLIYSQLNRFTLLATHLYYLCGSCLYYNCPNRC